MNIVIFDAKKKPNNSVSSPTNLAETIFKALDLNIRTVHATCMSENSAKPRLVMIKRGSMYEMLSVLKAKRIIRSNNTPEHLFVNADLTMTYTVYCY